jgi:hypothetical protein
MLHANIQEEFSVWEIAMKTATWVLLLFVGAASDVSADCPAKPPSDRDVAVADGDQKVDAGFLEKTLVGKRVRYSDGTESYDESGSYSYKIGNQTWDAPSFRFYDNGFRCIDYPNGPRFDYYVVNDGKLVLINGAGERFSGKVSK